MTDKLIRTAATFELRDEGDGGSPTMVVNFARFNEWTLIDSIWEGRFLEQMAPRAFVKTMRENKDQIRSIFQHGMDPTIGFKPLGAIQSMEERDDGAWGEVELFDAGYVRDLVPGIRAGVYGASFAFQPVRQTSEQPKQPSDHNPMMLEERTVKEVKLREFGPVTWGAYPNASSGIRSLTDDVMAHDPRFIALAERQREQEQQHLDEIVEDEASEAEETPARHATSLTLMEMEMSLMARRHPGRRA